MTPKAAPQTNPLSLSPLHRLASLAPLALRLPVGVVMAVHGWQKLTQIGPANLGKGMLSQLGVPAAVPVAHAMTFAELTGGVLLIVGLLTRLATLPLLVILVGAIVLVKTDLGLVAPPGALLPGAELDLALIGGLLAVLLLGPGRPSLDHLLGLETGVPVLLDSRFPTADRR